jgi:hypothetical protein
VVEEGEEGVGAGSCGHAVTMTRVEEEVSREEKDRRRSKARNDALGGEENVPEIRSFGEVLLAHPLYASKRNNHVAESAHDSVHTRRAKTHRRLVEKQKDRLNDRCWRTPQHLPTRLLRCDSLQICRLVVVRFPVEVRRFEHCLDSRSVRHFLLTDLFGLEGGDGVIGAEGGFHRRIDCALEGQIGSVGVLSQAGRKTAGEKKKRCHAQANVVLTLETLTSSASLQ